MSDLRSFITAMADLYARMEQAYERCAEEANLTCTGCQDNCCTSYFQHHTYSEWVYLWHGLRTLPGRERLHVFDAATAYMVEVENAFSSNRVPQVMCPLNRDGRCILYPYRLMICRMHGTRNIMTLPSGETRQFPGCIRFVERYPDTDEIAPVLDRTPFYQELATLEMQLLRQAKKVVPKVRMTLAEMLVTGPPPII